MIDNCAAHPFVLVIFLTTRLRNGKKHLSILIKKINKTKLKGLSVQNFVPNRKLNLKNIIPIGTWALCCLLTAVPTKNN